MTTQKAAQLIVDALFQNLVRFDMGWTTLAVEQEAYTDLVEEVLRRIIARDKEITYVESTT